MLKQCFGSPLTFTSWISHKHWDCHSLSRFEMFLCDVGSRSCCTTGSAFILHVLGRLSGTWWGHSQCALPSHLLSLKIQGFGETSLEIFKCLKKSPACKVHVMDRVSSMQVTHSPSYHTCTHTNSFKPYLLKVPSLLHYAVSSFPVTVFLVPVCVCSPAFVVGDAESSHARCHPGYCKSPPDL